MTINKSIGELTTLDGSLDKTLKASEQLKDLPQILQKYMLLGNYQIGNAKKFDSHSIFNDIGSIDGFIAQFVNLDEAQQKAFLSLSSFDEGLEDYIENTKNAVQTGEKFNSQLFEQIASQKDGITNGVLNEFMKAGGLKDAKGVLALPNTQDAIALMEDYANHCSDASKTQQLFNAGILEQENGVYKLSQAFLKEISVKQMSTVATVALTAAQKAWNVVAQYGKQLLLSLGVAAVAFIATKIVDYAKRLHIGDLYYDMKADDAYRWTDTFIWEALSDKNLLKVLRAASLENDTANGSRRVFFTTPSTPYSRGDIWASSSGDNKVLVCQTARPTTESFSRTDWAVALKYTDDTKANEALDAAGKIDGDLVSFKTEYNSDLESTKQQIEARVTTKKYNEDMSGLNTRISLTESKISKNENAIVLCATKTEAQKYADTAELNANKKLEEHIKTATESIDSKVAKTDYTGKNIATLINQSTNTVKIKATKLNLTGAISVDKNGKVALDSTSVNNSLTQVSGDKITTDTITVDKLKAGQIFQLLWKNDSKDAYSAVGEENKLTFEADSDYSEYIFIFRGYKEREVVEIDPESAATKRVLEYLSKVSVIVSKPVAGEWSGAEYHCATMNTPKLCMIYDLSAGDNSTPNVSYNSDTSIKSAFRPFYVKAYEKNNKYCTEITFFDAQSSGETAITTNNDLIIPCEIYGVK